MSHKVFTLSAATFFLIAGFAGYDAKYGSGYGNDDPEIIEQTILRLFDGMREGDGEKVKSVFTENALMQSVSMTEDGETNLRTGSLDDFVKAVGTERDDIWDEKIGSLTVHIDLPMASVWVPYKFYRGDTFSHCGVNSFQMIKKRGEWRIFYIVDTRRNGNCIE